MYRRVRRRGGAARRRWCGAGTAEGGGGQAAIRNLYKISGDVEIESLILSHQHSNHLLDFIITHNAYYNQEYYGQCIQSASIYNLST